MGSAPLRGCFPRVCLVCRRPRPEKFHVAFLGRHCVRRHIALGIVLCVHGRVCATALLAVLIKGFGDVIDRDASELREK